MFLILKYGYVCFKGILEVSPVSLSCVPERLHVFRKQVFPGQWIGHNRFQTCKIYGALLCRNVSTTPLRQWGFQQCLPFSWTTLRGKHCRHPIAVMGVVDMFEPGAQSINGLLFDSFNLES